MKPRSDFRSTTKIILVAGLTVLVCSCTFSGSNFVPSSSARYDPKPDDTEIFVFFEGAGPERKFDVIGMAYAHKNARTNFQSASPESVVELLKREARRHGGDAIIDTKVSPVNNAPRTRKLGEAKVVVFRK